MTEKQKLARMRNMAKFRLLGITLPWDGLSPKEQKLITELSYKLTEVRDLLLDDWDNQTRSLGLKPLPKHRIKGSDEWWAKQKKNDYKT